MKSFYPFKALLVVGLLTAPILATNTKAVTYIDETWSPTDTLTNANGNAYAYWNDPNNWSGGVVPIYQDSVSSNYYNAHFADAPGSIVPCLITNAVDVGSLVIGDYGGSGTVIVTNGGSLKAGWAGPTWTGVGFPNGPGTLYVGKGCTATFGSHLWVGNGVGAQGTVTVDGGTLDIPNGQLGVSWNGIGGTNYIYVTNGASAYLSQWVGQTLGYPGASVTNLGIMDIGANSQVVITNNALSMMKTVITNGQLIAFGGAGVVQAIYNPALNITILTGLTSGPGPKPVLLSQPTNIVVTLGATATFSVNVSNEIVNYQWLFNDAPITDGGGISGSKTATITIAGVTLASVGEYSVTVTDVTDAREYAVSDAASLTAEAMNFYPVVTIYGIPGNTYEVDYTTSLTPPVTWTPLTTVTLGSFTQYVVDTATPMRLVRSYRLVQQ